MSIGGQQQQASLYYARRAQRSRQFIASATPWSSGLTIVAGDIVQSFGLAFVAQTDGVTGSTPPNNSGGALFVGTDGIEWRHQPLLLVAPALVT